MGAVTFSIDPKLIHTLRSSLTLDAFVETGTFEGETIELVKNDFNNIYSIELSPEYYKKASQRFEKLQNVTVIQGNSTNALKTLAPQLQEKAVVYWLDAHWCIANDTAGQASQCPLLEELKAIHSLHSDSVIVIDDARLFLATPPAPHEISHWPNFQEILNILNQLSNSHNIMVVNDCILFFPQKIEAAIQSFAHQHGLNWLSVLDKSRDYDTLTVQLQQKEQEINHLKRICNEREKALIEASNNDTSDYFNQMLARIIELETTDFQALDKIPRAPDSFHLTIQKQEMVLHQMQEVLAQHCKMVEAQLEIILTSNKMIAKLQKMSPVYYMALLKKFIKAPFRTIKKLIHICLAPKLGKLVIHPPKPLTIPTRYQKKSVGISLPTISIVTPAFNQGIFLERTIKSIIDQHYPHLEYIIQDGNSTDNTTEVLKRYESSIKHWESKKDDGQSHAINLGFQHSTGNIMAYLNSDDILLPGTLDYVGQYFAKNPDVDVIYGHRVLIDNDDNEIGRWVLPPHNSEVLSWADYIPQETLFWRRSIWEKAGGKIDESFSFAMDWDLILRFRDANAKFVRLPRFLGAFRVHPQQKTSAEISNTGIEEMQRLRDRYNKHSTSAQEAGSKVRFYLLHHAICHKLYRLGLLRY